VVYEGKVWIAQHGGPGAKPQAAEASKLLKIDTIIFLNSTILLCPELIAPLP